MSDNLDDLDFLIENSDLADPYAAKEVDETTETPEVPVKVDPVIPSELINDLLDGDEDEEEITEIEEIEEEDDDTPTNSIAPVGRYFSKIGLFNLTEEEASKLDWDEDTFLEKAEEAWEQRSQEYFQSKLVERFGPRGEEFFDKVIEKGLPYQSFLQSLNQEESVENLDPETHSEKIVRLYLNTQGMEDEDVEDQIEFFKSNETLVNKAERFKLKLLETERTKRAAETARIQALKADAENREKERAEAYLSTLKTAIKAGDLNGLPLKQKDAQDLYSFVTEKPHIVPNTGQKFTDFEYKLSKMKHEDPDKFLTIAKLVFNDVDLSQVVKQEKTKKAASLVEEFKSKKTPTMKQKGELNFLLNKK